MTKQGVVTEGAIGNIVIYRDEDEKVHVQAILSEETLWLTQKLMADLFDTTKQNISNHLKKIFDEGGISGEFSCQIFLYNCRRWQTISDNALQP